MKRKYGVRGPMPPRLPLAVMIAVAAGLATVAHGSWAEDAPDFPPGFHGNESVAVTDDAAGFFLNPAAGGMRYPSEMLLSWGMVDPRGSGGLGPEPESKSFMRGIFSFGGFGLGGSHMQDGPNAIRLGLGGGGDQRIGTAFTWRWSADGSERALDLSIGTLSRPSPSLSLGAVVDHVAQPRFPGSTLRREYTLGIGLRPLALSRPHAATLGPNLTFSADVRMREGQPNKTALARFGGEIEIVPGIALRGSYENDGGFRLGMAVMSTMLGYHGQTGDMETSAGRFQSHSISVHEGEDVSILSTRAEQRVAVVHVAGQLTDESLTGFGLLESGGGTSAWWVHHQLERALEDRLTRGVLLDVRGVAGLAHVEELRARIRRLRDAGKPVVAFLPHGAGRAGLMLAGACDRVVTTPDAYYRALGLRIERRYYRALLEKWGLKLERTSHGRYKSAYREFSVDSTTDADRESIERVLDVNQELFVSAVEDDRNLERERLLAVLDGRWWRSEDLRAAGLVDSIGYRESAMRTIGELTGLGEKPRTVNYVDLQRVRRAWHVPVRVAVIYASGGLERGSSGSDLVFGPFLGAETAMEQIEAAFRNRTVQAVVLRVESPGGDALAANLIYATLHRMKEETKKPLIVSMGSVAASGGYEIAVPADRIYANRFTYTGSIGTFFVKPSAEGLYRNWGVRQDEFERGAYMRGLSPNKDWDEEIQASADSATFRHYSDFVATVAENRHMSWGAVDSVAQGRVWMGEDARERGLVDEIGTLEDAIAEARRRAGIPPGEKIRIAQYRRPRPGFIERYLGSMVGELWRRQTHLPQLGAAYHWADVPYAEGSPSPLSLPILGAAPDPSPRPPTHVFSTR